MREPVDAARILELTRALGREARSGDVRVYLAGGSSAVLKGWRPTTVDVDLKIVPDSDPLLRALAVLKERLRLNVELASPDDFIPELPGRTAASSSREREESRSSTTISMHRPFPRSSADTDRMSTTCAG